MRLVELEGGWVVLRPLSVRGWQLLQQGESIVCLSLHIAEWSEKEPVSVGAVQRLRADVHDRLLYELRQTVEPVFSMDKDLLRRYIRMFLKGIRTPQDATHAFLVDNYFWLAQSMCDHKGNIVTLPEKGGWLDQPLDWAFVLAMYRLEFVEYLAAQQRSVRR